MSDQERQRDKSPTTSQEETTQKLIEKENDSLFAKPDDVESFADFYADSKQKKPSVIEEIMTQNKPMFVKPTEMSDTDDEEKIEGKLDSSSDESESSKDIEDSNKKKRGKKKPEVLGRQAFVKSDKPISKVTTKKMDTIDLEKLRNELDVNIIKLQYNTVDDLIAKTIKIRKKHVENINTMYKEDKINESTRKILLKRDDKYYEHNVMEMDLFETRIEVMKNVPLKIKNQLAYIIVTIKQYITNASQIPNKGRHDIHKILATELYQVIKREYMEIIIKQIKYDSFINKTLKYYDELYLERKTNTTEYSIKNEVIMCKLDLPSRNNDKLSADNNTYIVPNHIAISQIVKYTPSKSNNVVIKHIQDNRMIVILDRANMIKASRMEINHIEIFVKCLAANGISTIDIVDKEETIIKNATTNIVASKDEHDDIIGLLYAMCRKGIIVTLDTHTEFKESINYCSVHNNVLLRKQEMCFQTQGQKCQVLKIPLNNPQYLRIQKTEMVGKKLKIVSLKRYTKKYNKKEDEFITTYWELPTEEETRKVEYLTTNNLTNSYKCIYVESDVTLTTYAAVSMSMFDSEIAMVASSKIKTIIAMLNYIDHAAYTEIIKKINTTITCANGQMMLNYNTGVSREMDDIILETTLRNKLSQKMLCKNKDTITLTPRKRIPINRWHFETTKLQSHSKLVMNKKLVQDNVVILLNNQDIHLSYITADLKTMLEKFLLDNFAAQSDVKIEGLPTSEEGLEEWTQSISVETITNKIIGRVVNNTTTSKVFNNFKKLSQTEQLYYALQDLDDATLIDTEGIENFSYRNKTSENQINVAFIKGKNFERMNYADARAYENFYDNNSANEATVMITQLKNTSSIAMNNISDDDWKRIESDLLYYANIANGRVLRDVTEVFRQTLLNESLPFLPPLTVGFKTYKYNTINPNVKFPITVTIIYSGVNLIVKMMVTPINKCSYIIVTVKPEPNLLFAVVALNTGHSDIAEYRLNDNTKDTVMDFGYHLLIMGVIEDAHRYMPYIYTFTIPLNMVGKRIIDVVVMYKPVIEGNVVEKVVKSIDGGWHNPGAVEQTEAKYWVYNILNDDFEVTLQRQYINGHYDTPREIHGMLQSFAKMYGAKDRRKRLLQTLNIVTTLFPCSAFLSHMTQCYDVSVNRLGDTIDIIKALDISDFREKLKQDCVCVVKQYKRIEDEDTLDRWKRIGGKVVTYEDGTSALMDSHSKPLVIDGPRWGNNDVITKALPLSSTFTLVWLTNKKFNPKNRRRMQNLFDYITQRSVLHIETKKMEYNGQIENVSKISKTINNILQTTGRLILLAEDNIPSLMKTHKTVWEFTPPPLSSIVIPDAQLYAYMKAHTNITEMDNETTMKPLSNPDTDSTKVAGAQPRKQQKETDNRIYWVTGGLIALVLVALLVYTLWPHIVKAVFAPGNFLLRRLGTVDVTVTPPSWFLTMLGYGPNVVTHVTLPAWARLLAMLANVTVVMLVIGLAYGLVEHFRNA